MRVGKLLESFLAFFHHLREHVDDVAVRVGAVDGDHLVDGVLELAVVPDDLLRELVDGVRVLGRLVVRDVDIMFLLLVHRDDMPLSLILSTIVPLADFVFSIGFIDVGRTARFIDVGRAA